MSDLAQLQQTYQQFKALNLSLNIERGQPSNENFDLCLDLLESVDRDLIVTDNGVDIRNYPGGILGLAEARELFSEQLRVDADEIMIGNNSSLELMSRIFSSALLHGVNGSAGGWIHDQPRMIVTVPGYDRHFSLIQSLGFEMVPVSIDSNGPNIDAIESLAASDSRIKGIFFVPTYSNPTGDTISEANAKRLIGLTPAATDFTIFADDAYGVHHLVDDPPAAPNLLSIAKAAGFDNRVIVFGSTSKVTFAGSGLGMAGMSRDNLAYWSSVFNKQTIGPNKAEQWRHVQFLRHYPGGLRGLMKDHAKILKPKFDAVQEILNAELGNLGLATWTDPRGGYFVSLKTALPIATRVVSLASEAGLSLTPPGAPHPNGHDPDDCIIRIAPTRPPLGEVRQAMEILACCIKLAAAEHA
jgi:DNA-binding transcriptional MocR family regulator